MVGVPLLILDNQQREDNLVRLEAQAKKKFPETNSSDSSLAGLTNSSSNSPGVAAIFSQLTGTYGIDDGSAMLVFTKCKCAKCNGSGHQHGCQN